MGLRDLRIKQGLTQQQLAEKSGIQRVNVAQFESGTRDLSNASLATGLRLADALHVSNPKKLLEPDVLPKPERKPSKPRKPRVTLEDMSADEISALMDDVNPDDLLDDLDEEA